MYIGRSNIFLLDKCLININQQIEYHTNQSNLKCLFSFSLIIKRILPNILMLMLLRKMRSSKYIKCIKIYLEKKYIIYNFYQIKKTAWLV